MKLSSLTAIVVLFFGIVLPKSTFAYYVQSHDTVISIAQENDISWVDIQESNPHTDLSQISEGQWLDLPGELYVPEYNKLGAVSEDRVLYFLSQLRDTEISSPSVNDVLVYDGTDWVNLDTLTLDGATFDTVTSSIIYADRLQLTSTTAFKDIVSPHDPTDYLYFNASGGGGINYVGNGTVRGSINNTGFSSTGYMSADGGINDGYQIRNHPNTNLTSPDGTFWVANTEDGEGGKSEAWRANQDYFKIRNRWSFFTPDELTTTDATTTTIATTTLATDSSGLIKAELLAKQDGGAAAAAYEINAYYVNNGGTVTLIENFNPTFAAESNVNFDYDLEISGTDVLVKVNGLAATTIKWQANVTVKTLTDD